MICRKIRNGKGHMLCQEWRFSREVREDILDKGTFKQCPSNIKSSYKSIRQILQYKNYGTPLVVQWLRTCLPVQGTWVQAPVQEDPTCHGATKPLRHNYWAWVLEPASHNYWACVPQLLKPVCLEPVLRNKRFHRNEKPAHCNEE